MCCAPILPNCLLFAHAPQATLYEWTPTRYNDLPRAASVYRDSVLLPSARGTPGRSWRIDRQTNGLPDAGKPYYYQTTPARGAATWSLGPPVPSRNYAVQAVNVRAPSTSLVFASVTMPSDYQVPIGNATIRQAFLQSQYYKQTIYLAPPPTPTGAWTMYRGCK